MQYIKKLNAANHLKAVTRYTLAAAFFAFILKSSVYAGNIGTSKLAQGIKNLIQDVSSWLLVLAPATGILLCVYFFIRRSAADEMDQKKWNNRIIATVISVIGAVVTSATLAAITLYFK